LLRKKIQGTRLPDCGQMGIEQIERMKTDFNKLKGG
jgi:hypothetical protein